MFYDRDIWLCLLWGKDILIGQLVVVQNVKWPHDSNFSHVLDSELQVLYTVASSNMSCLEAHVGFFRLLMKGIFDPYALWPFEKKEIS